MQMKPAENTTLKDKLWGDNIIYKKDILAFLRRLKEEIKSYESYEIYPAQVIEIIEELSGFSDEEIQAVKR